jgi:hypothetical protein
MVRKNKAIFGTFTLYATISNENSTENAKSIFWAKIPLCRFKSAEDCFWFYSEAFFQDFPE